MKTSATICGLLGLACVLVTSGLTATAYPAGEIAGQDLSEGGFGRSAPVIAALEKFRHNQGRYPGQERELTPRYLPAGQTYGSYRLNKDGSFALSFGYVRGQLPGLSIWTYRSSSRRWIHSGYY